MKPTMKPTMKLAWISVFGYKEGAPRIHVEYPDGDQYYPGTCEHDWALHQWWEDASGKGEWHEIEAITKP